MPKFKILIFLLALLTLFSSCQNTDTGTGNLPPNSSAPLRLTPDEDKIAVFALGSPENFWAREDRGNGAPFNCAFSRSNVSFNDGLLTLALTKSQNGYVGAEYRTMQKYSYGYYSVSFKPAKCSGVISSFFTYTGWPWDEIDIEFLGNDTTRVQFNYYTNGKGGHEYLYILGFDASESFHEYGFDWQKDSITWYVDGRAVYRATKDIPTTAGNIMMNLWNVDDSAKNWAGAFNEDQLPVYSQYQWIGYKSA